MITAYITEPGGTAFYHEFETDRVIEVFRACQRNFGKCIYSYVPEGERYPYWVFSTGTSVCLVDCAIHTGYQSAKRRQS